LPIEEITTACFNIVVVSNIEETFGLVIKSTWSELAKSF